MARANRVFEANSLKENALTEGKHLGTRSDRQLSASLNDDSNDENVSSMGLKLLKIISFDVCPRACLLLNKGLTKVLFSNREKITFSDINLYSIFFKFNFNDKLIFYRLFFFVLFSTACYFNMCCIKINSVNYIFIQSIPHIEQFLLRITG